MRSNSVRTLDRKNGGFECVGLDYSTTFTLVHNVLRLFEPVEEGSLEGERRKVALGVHPDVQPVPRVQLLLIDFLIRLMQAGVDHDGAGEAVRHVLDDLGFWDVISGSAFFAFRGGDLDEGTKNERNRLRNGCVGFLGFVGSLANVSNEVSCGLVLRLVEDSRGEDRVADLRAGCGALRTMLRCCQSQTQQSLLSLSSLRIFISLLSDTGLMASPLRWTIFTVIDLTYYDNQDVSVASFLDRTVLNTYFHLLMTPTMDKHLRRFALDRLVDIMNVMLADFPTYLGLDLPTSAEGESPPTISEDSETAPDLLGRYLSCFPAEITTDGQMEIQVMLLGGLREVVAASAGRSERRKRVQRCLIRNKVFQHLLAVLSVRVFSDGAGDVEVADGTRRYRMLVEETLKVLAEVLRENEIGKKGFRELGGYEEIRVRVFVKGGWRAWEGFLRGMFLLAFDGDVPSGGAKAGWDLAGCVVRNRDAISAVVKMWEHFGEDLRSGLVGGLARLLWNEGNRVAFLKMGLLGKVLRGVLPGCQGEVLKGVVDLCRGVGGYSVGVADVRLFLACLRERRGKGRGEGIVRRMIGDGESEDEQEDGLLPFWYDRMLECLVDVAGRKEVDMDFFVFSGRGSGIVLPRGEKWPGVAGWSFMVWVKVDGVGAVTDATPALRTRRRSSIHLERPGRKTSFVETGRRRRGSSAGREGRGGSSAPQPNRPRIFSLLTPSGNGVEICITEDGVLQLIVARGDRTTTVPIPDVRLTSDKWHFVAVSQSAPIGKGRVGSSSQAWVHVDGLTRWKGDIDFPALAVHAIGRIGASGRRDGDDRGGGACREELDGPLSGGCYHCFAGQMGSVFVFDDAISEAGMKGVWKLGAGYSGQFRVDAARKAMGVGAEDGSVFEGGLTAHLALQYHPTATRGNEACFDVSPRMGGRGLIVSFGGVRTVSWSGEAEMRGVLTVQTGSVGRAVHALGGVSVLFPILGQVGLGVEGEDEAEDGESKLKVNKRMGKRTALVLKLLAILVGGDPLHRDGFRECKGPRIISGLIQQMNVSGLSMEVLDAVMSLVASTHPDERLVNELESVLVFEPRLWACASLSVQIEYFEFLRHYVKANISQFRSDNGVAFWMDILTRCYWYIPLRSLSTDLLARLAASRPRDVLSVRLLRRSVWGIVKIFLTDVDVSVEDLGKVVQCLAVGEDGVHVGEVLEYLLEFVESEGKQGGRVLDLACQAGLVDVLFDMVMNVEEKTRVLALQGLFAVLTVEEVASKWKKKARMEDLSGVVGGAAGGAGGLGPGCGTRVLGRVLARRGFSERMHHALLQCAIEEPVLDRETQEVLRDVGTIRNAKLRNPGFLHVALEMAVKYSFGAVEEESVDDGKDVRFRAQVLQDALVVAMGGANADRVRSVVGWQVPYMMLVAQDGISRDENGAEQEDTNASKDDSSSTPQSRKRSSSVATVDQHILQNLGMEVLVGVILDAFGSDRKAWRLVEETSALAFLFWKEKEAVKFLWGLLCRILGLVRREVAAGDWKTFGDVKMVRQRDAGDYQAKIANYHWPNLRTF
ncbi:hypothetical protein HK097_000390 [Rhizophlyctis rosea]|uniref:Uncharacterized protein n=1 Tax=Rhizophlyctis rosea TaxID=64517 RepID=A0AAD5S813_9FUNG|nr:hypothetical protein HK097_000390 [Rhizophlyctis rosea]